jgi:hypothetical protein
LIFNIERPLTILEDGLIAIENSKNLYEILTFILKLEIMSMVELQEVKLMGFR